MSTTRLGHVITRVLALVAIGLGVSLADAWVRGPIQTGLRPNPVPDAVAPAPTQDRPGSDERANGAPDRSAGQNTDQPATASSEPAEAAASNDAIDTSSLPLEFGIDVAYPLWERSMTQADVQFVDARAPDKFLAAHIPGSFWVAPSSFDRGIPPAIDMLVPDLPTVIYCTGGTCHDAEQVGIELQNFGFTSVHVFTGGMPAWLEAGHPVESGPDMLGQPEGAP